MTDKSHFDVIVIGTGPGGEGASMKAAKSGKSVAAVERYVRVGGGATHWGTIPSKALRRAIHRLNLLSQSPIYKRLDVSMEIDFRELMQAAYKVIDEQSDLRQGFYDRNHVPLIPGQAKFVDAKTIEVESEGGARRTYTADHFVVATGSRPYRPAGLDFSHPRCLDSDTLLNMQFTPRSIIIYGAGVIGCEYASMLRFMGMDVTLIDTREKLLSFLDDEIIDALSYHFSDKGIMVMHNEEFESLEYRENSVTVCLKSGKRMETDVFLWANGRSGNTEGLGLESVGVTPNSRGQITVNENFQTTQPNIYAVGDVVGWPSLASASYDQGRFAASHICGGADYRLVKDVPVGIYTSPEISMLGKTERELTAEKVPYSVGKAPFRTLAYAQISGVTVGMLKLLYHRDTHQILGIHCFGQNAAEIIHIGQAIMSQPAPNNSVDYFLHTTFNYPTMAEAYRVAALRGLDRFF